MKRIDYRKFFKKATENTYESSRQLVDSFFTYQSLLNYRWSLAPDNDNYWYLLNATDLAQLETNFNGRFMTDGKDLPVDNVRKLVAYFKDLVIQGYATSIEQNKVQIVRDTLKLIRIWEESLEKLSKIR